MSNPNRQYVESLPKGSYVAFVSAKTRKDWGLMAHEVAKISGGHWDANNVSRVGEINVTKEQLLAVADNKHVGVLRIVPTSNVEAVRTYEKRHIVGMQPLV